MKNTKRYTYSGPNKKFYHRFFPEELKLDKEKEIRAVLNEFKNTGGIFNAKELIKAMQKEGLPTFQSLNLLMNC